MDDGYLFWAERRLVTIFSAPDYGKTNINKGAMLCVNVVHESEESDVLECNFKILQTDRPADYVAEPPPPAT